MTNPCKRYTQPVVQIQPGPEFKIAEVPLFEDPKGKWVKWEDYERLQKRLRIARNIIVTNPYHVEPTHCQCHPETCCCPDYTLLAGDYVVARGGNKAELQELVDAANGRSVEPSEWQTVETAPEKDGWYWCYQECPPQSYPQRAVQFKDHHWMTSWNVTHWMLLPKPPSQRTNVQHTGD